MLKKTLVWNSARESKKRDELDDAGLIDPDMDFGDLRVAGTARGGDFESTNVCKVNTPCNIE